MTYEEAKYWFNHNGADISQEIEMAKVINKALDKQIPKRPYEKYEYMGNIGYGLNPTEYIKGYVCPTCGEWLEEGDHHCPCGQVLNWGDEE